MAGRDCGRVLQFSRVRQFPLSVFFILATEICERFTTRGSLRAVLVLYLKSQLGFNDNHATAIYHLFITFSYLLTIIGALISDSCLGKYWTVLILSAIFACGNVLLTVSSSIPTQLQTNIALAMLALVIIMFGMGGIKSCVAAFGGDQFKEGQKDMLSRFFSLFYFAINVGAAAAGLLIPVLRSSIHCFGTSQCFPVAFGVPSVLMIVSIVCFVAGTKFYIVKKPQREAIFLFIKVPASVLVAIYCRLKRGKSPDKKYLLYYADHKFSRSFLDDVRLTLRVLMMMFPLLFWTSLFGQQGSRWTLQASRMSGRLGKLTIQPDQLLALNPLFLLFLIPLFQAVIYPLLARCNVLTRLLQRIITGLVLAVLAFVVAGILQLQVEAADTTLKPGEGKAIFTNTLPETVQLQLSNETVFNLSSGESHIFHPNKLGNFSFSISDSFSVLGVTTGTTELVEQHVTHILMAANNGSVTFAEEDYREEIPVGGSTSVHVLNSVPTTSFDFLLCTSEKCNNDEIVFTAKNLFFLHFSNHSNISSATYFYKILSNSSFLAHNWTQTGKLETFSGGAIYTIAVVESLKCEEYNVTVVEVTAPSSISMLLQVPMYLIITVSEVMVGISAVEFAYSQAPTSMKSICQTSWLWTIAFGHVMVSVVAELSLFNSQAIEFFFFAGLLSVIIIPYTLMSYFYKYVDLTPSATGEIDDDALSSEQGDDAALLDDSDLSSDKGSDEMDPSPVDIDVHPINNTMAKESRL